MPRFNDHKKLLDDLPYPVFAKNDRQEILYGNRALAKLLGRDDFVGMTDKDLFPMEQAELFKIEDSKVLAGEESINEERVGADLLALTHKVPAKYSDGSIGVFGVVVASAKPNKSETLKEAYDDDLLRVATMTRRLKNRFKAEIQTLQTQLTEADGARAAAMVNAQTDTATGLRNRAGLNTDLEAAIEKYHRNGTRFGLALLDFDHFKRVNDRFGHGAGDLVLKVIGKRLCKLPYVASVARMGGDEFAIITELPSVEGVNVEGELERARSFTFRPILYESKHIPLSGSLGVSIYPDDAHDGEDLKRHADAALLSAKRNGRGRIQLFDAAIQKARDRRLKIENSLLKAIPGREIQPAYQPIVASDGHAVAGVEVLAR